MPKACSLRSATRGRPHVAQGCFVAGATLPAPSKRPQSGGRTLPSGRQRGTVARAMAVVWKRGPHSDLAQWITSKHGSIAAGEDEARVAVDCAICRALENVVAQGRIGLRTLALRERSNVACQLPFPRFALR